MIHCEVYSIDRGWAKPYSMAGHKGGATGGACHPHLCPRCGCCSQHSGNHTREGHLSNLGGRWGLRLRIRDKKNALKGTVCQPRGIPKRSGCPNSIECICAKNPPGKGRHLQCDCIDAPDAIVVFIRNVDASSCGGICGDSHGMVEKRFSACPHAISKPR